MMLYCNLNENEIPSPKKWIQTHSSCQFKQFTKFVALEQVIFFSFFFFLFFVSLKLILTLYISVIISFFSNFFSLSSLFLLSSFSSVVSGRVVAGVCAPQAALRVEPLGVSTSAGSIERHHGTRRKGAFPLRLLFECVRRCRELTKLGNAC